MRKYVPTYRSRGKSEKITGLVIGGIVFSILGGAIITLLLYLFIDQYNPFFNRSATGPIKILLLSIPFLAVIKALDATTLGYDETRYSVYIRDFGQEGITLLLIGLMIFQVGTETGIAIGYVVAMAGTMVIAIIATQRVGGFDSFPSISFEFKEWVPYTLVTIFASVTQLAIGWTDILVLSMFVTSGPVGEYQAAYQTSALLTFALVAVNSIFPSIASRLYEKDQMDNLRQLYQTLVKWTGALTVTSVTYVVLLPVEILSIFGTGFQNATQVLILLAIAQGVVALVGPAGYILLMTGRERIEMVNNVVLSCINLVGNLFLVPSYGILGAAIATGVSLSLLNIARFAEIRYLFGFSLSLGDILKVLSPVLPVAIAVFVVRSMTHGYILTLVTAAIFGGVVFILLSYKFITDENDEMLLEAV